MLLLESKHPRLDPAYAVSVGNQTDQTIGDIAAFLKDCGGIDVIAVYVDIQNPMDINPAADDLTHVRIVATLAADCIVVGVDPLSPAMRTLPDNARPNASLTSRNSIAMFMPELIAQLDKPIVGVVDGGRLYDPVADALEDGGMPVFRSASLAVASLAKYVNGRLYADRIRSDPSAP